MTLSRRSIPAQRLCQWCLVFTLGLGLVLPTKLYAQKGSSVEEATPTPLLPPAPGLSEPLLVPIVPFERPFTGLPSPTGADRGPEPFGAMLDTLLWDERSAVVLSRLPVGSDNAAAVGTLLAEQNLPLALIDTFGPGGAFRRHIQTLTQQGRAGVPDRFPLCGPYDVLDAQGECGARTTFEVSGAQGFFDHHHAALLAFHERIASADYASTEALNEDVSSYRALLGSIEALQNATSLLFFPSQPEVLERVAIINDVLSRRHFAPVADTVEPLQISIQPRDGEIAAEQLHRLELEVSGAREGETFFVAIEGRHNLFPEGDWGTADLRLIEPLEDLGCTEHDDLGTLSCTPGESGTAQFFIDVPDSPILHWKAVSTGDESRQAEGTLPILQSLSASVREVEEPEDIPQLAFVSSVYPQTGLTGDGYELVNHYPYGTGEFVTHGDRWRYLLLIGRNLPLQARDTELSEDPTIRYFFQESHQSVAGRAFNESHLDWGLRQYAEPGESSIQVLNRLRDANMDMLVVFADLQEGVLPGPKSFQLNGQSVPWVLSFADTAAALSFVRQSPEGQGVFEAVGESFGGEQLFVQLEVRPGEMPYGEIPIVLTTEDGDTGNTQEISFTLQPARNGRWRSSALDLNYEGDGQAVVLKESDGAFSKLHARLATDFTAQFMPFGLGLHTEVELVPAPEETQWIEDLRTAARCTGYRFEDYTPEDLAFLEAAYEDGDPFSNVMVLNEFERMSQEMRHGHLAGALTLRRAFLLAASAEANRLRATLNNRDLMTAQIVGWRRAFGRLDVDGPLSPLFKIEVPLAPLSGTSTFGRVFEYPHTNGLQLRQEGFSDSQILDWHVNLGVQVTHRMIEGIERTTREVRGIDPCDALELIKFAYGTEVLAEMVVSTMMRPTPYNGWEPDVAARRWVRSTVGVARAYHEQVLASENDTDTASFALAVLTMPLAILNSAAITAVTTAIDIADLSSNVYGTADRYRASQAELAQSFGLSSVAGDARYREALRRRLSAPATALQIGFGVIMVGFDGFQLSSALRASEGERLLRQMDGGASVELSPEGVEQLTALRDRLLQRQALDGSLSRRSQADLDRLLDGEFLDGAMLGTRRAPPPGAPVGPAPDVPTRIAPTDAQIAQAARHGTSPEGIPRVMVLETDAPSLGVLDAIDGTHQRSLEALDQDLEVLAQRLPAGDIESFVITQTRQILHDPDTLVGAVANLGDIGSGKFNNSLKLHYLIRLDPSAFSGVRAHGIRWETLAILAHEAAHRVQSRLQQISGFTIGRAMRELDASLVMVAAQNASARMLGQGQTIGQRQAMAFAFNYALDVQTQAWRAGGLGSRFSEPINYFDGLFQLNWTEAVARARAYLPGVSERTVLEEFIRAQRRAATANGSILAGSQIARQHGVMDRWRSLISEAEARLATLAP